MDPLILQPTSTAQWHSLVNEAICTSGVHLSEELESYLVFMLMRYTENPHISNGMLAIDYLQSQQSTGKVRRVALQDVGDKCLLFSGLFPGLASSRQVRVSYFVKLGQSAYCILSHLERGGLSPLYYSLSEDFVPLMDVLQAFRSFEENKPLLSPIEALELWSDTQSEGAFRTLQEQIDKDAFILNNYNNKSTH